MTSLPFTKTEGINFTAVHTGKWTDLDKQAFDHPGLPEPFPEKLFLKDLLKLTGMEVIDEPLDRLSIALISNL